MATEKDENMRRMFKNEERIGAGKKESVSDILARGSEAKPENMTFTEHEAKKKDAGQSRPNLDAKIADRKKELEKDEADRQAKELEKQKDKEKEKGKE